MYFAAFHNYADFSGRASRSEYWYFQLLNFIVLLIAIGLSGSGLFALMLGGDSGPALASVPFTIGVTILVFWLLVAFVPSIAVTVRRFHDRDMSGWWYPGFILMQCIPFVGWIAWIVWMVMMAMPGTPGDNRFGADPRDRGWGGNAFA